MAMPKKFAGKTIAVLGYSEDGAEYAKRLREQGYEVVIGLRERDVMWPRAEQDGFKVMNLWNAIGASDIIQVW
ncbi:acetohydroxy acid isomeroreductase [Paenibacillus naphthalenovorans]|uniref:Acetohydroxy acid isomeroreductase n=2 Tax=Paenibacillus naphthalenovorans TaxID=162209 RepID=A0A0U2VM45_9BACL|nr:acetohydroxy acid isomeroreductase [Paenibacillus naphthalenovorans]